MLIDAMKYVQHNIPLYIAGKGPLEKQLRKQAENDPRIKFLGFITDAEVEQYYANALVVPYFPYDEDYGLVTAEAMLHKKPVITTVDSGGPTEFVFTEKTGFCTNVDVKEIAEKIDYFVDNVAEAKRMGENGYELVKGITWEAAISSLLGKNELFAQPVRHKLTVTTTFPIYPPQGGGQARVFHLYKELAKSYDIEIISLTNSDQKPFNELIAPNLREIRIPKTQKHQIIEQKAEKQAGIPVSDIVAIHNYIYTPAYMSALSNSAASANLIITSQPYLFYAAKEVSEGKPIIYESANVEWDLKKDMLSKSSLCDKLLESVFAVERDVCGYASEVFTCSQEDLYRLTELYEVPTNKVVVIPNGVDSEETLFTSLTERRKNKTLLNLNNVKLVLQLYFVNELTY